MPWFIAPNGVSKYQKAQAQDSDGDDMSIIEEISGSNALQQLHPPTPHNVATQTQDAQQTQHVPHIPHAPLAPEPQPPHVPHDEQGQTIGSNLNVSA